MAEYKLFAKRRGLSAHAGNKETKLPPTIHVWSEEESEDDEDVITPKVQGKHYCSNISNIRSFVKLNEFHYFGIEM